jgi:predicted small secreted protein
MKKFVLFVLAGLLLTTVIGCGTVKGIGEDVTTIGNWLTRGSDRAKQGT